MASPPPQTIVANNRINIPAICRIPGKGTAFLVSPGILMTSLSVLGSKQDASGVKAIFFENGKQDAVSVDLMPASFFFSSAFPDYLDYCLVAVDTKHIYNVKPVKFPVVLPQIPDVSADETCLIVQHPLPHKTENGWTSPDETNENKRFEPIERRSRDLFHFKHNSLYDNGGSPVFNEKGQLVGLHSQRYIEGEGYVNRAVHLSSILMHLFANSQLNKIETKTAFDEIWSCWFTPDDITSGMKVVQNFSDWQTRQQALLELCTVVQEADETQLPNFAKCDGIKSLLENLVRFKNEQAVVAAILKTLWRITFGKQEYTDEVVKRNGTPEIMAAMKKYSGNEDIAEYGNVLLYNISLNPEYRTIVTFEGGLQSLLATMRGFTSSQTVYKFGYGALGNLCLDDTDTIAKFVQAGGIDTLCTGMTAFPNNEYLNENAMKLCASCAKYEAFRLHKMAPQLIKCIIAAMYKFKDTTQLAKHANNALWDMGTEPRNRVVICDNEGLEILLKTVATITDVF
mmetsp:Transcript_32261/g.57882  ORF Transcript_32261/g.57882 Transcript_32261/m.57882 type:complete len:513 (-) Transcript_32261:791-2329(-)